MARRFLTGLAAPIIFVYLMPDPSLAARLELRHAGAATAILDAVVGQEIEVELWVDSDNDPLSGAAVFISFDPSVFELVGEDRVPVVSGFQPFAPGDFLSNGEIFRNVVLAEDDPAAAPSGVQLDYSVVRAVDAGRGAAASFRLRAIAPAASSVIRIDKSGIRETRFFMPDGGHEQFRFVTPLSVNIRGIGLENLPGELVLARGAVDTTTFLLGEALFDPIYSADKVEWTISSVGEVLIEHLTASNHMLRLTAPTGSSPWERLTITARNPDGQFATVVVDIFVNAGPALSRSFEGIEMSEDGSYTLDLAELVYDPDTPFDQLRWSSLDGNAIAVEVEGTLAQLQPAADWFGETEVELVVTDNYDFSDTTAIAVSVVPVNDPPEVLISPNVQVILGKQDSSLSLHQLLADADDAIAELELIWSGNERVDITSTGEKLILSAPVDWVGSETIQLQVADAGGLTATGLLTVHVVPSLPPSLVNAPSRLGMIGGDRIVVDLNEAVVDPDDPDELLVWTASGNEQLFVNINRSGAARIEAAAGFSGIETVTFTVADPTGETASFDLLVFAAPAGGEPLIAPLPLLQLPVGGVDASVDLDSFVFDLDHEPAAMVWHLPETEGLELGVDPTSHVLTVSALDSSAAGAHQVSIRVSDPDGKEAAQTLSIVVSTPAGEVAELPSNEELPPFATLSAIPAISVTAGEFDQSIILDDYVSGIDPSQLTWSASGGGHVQVFIDTGSRTLTVLAESDWEGPEIILLRAEDDFGNVLETTLGVQVLPALAALSLAELTELALLAGDTKFFLSLSGLAVVGDAAELTWRADGPQAMTVEIRRRAR